MSEIRAASTPSVWPERDQLFRTVFRQTYGSIFNDKQLESLRKDSLEGYEQEPTERRLMLAKVLAHGLTPEKINQKVEQSLEPLTKEQRQATKLVIGYHPDYCDTSKTAITKESSANELGVTIDELDVLLQGAIASLTHE